MILNIPFTESHLAAISALVAEANAANLKTHEAALATDPQAVAPEPVTVESMIVQRNIQMADSYLARTLTRNAAQ